MAATGGLSHCELFSPHLITRFVQFRLPGRSIGIGAHDFDQGLVARNVHN